jgi:hypothetical protein
MPTNEELTQALDANTSNSSTSKVVLANNENEAKPLTKDNAPVEGGPSNTPINASGNAAKADTTLKKANLSIPHVCNIPIGIAQQINKAGMMGGQIILAIRKAIKALIAGFSSNPSGQALTSFFKQVARALKNLNKTITDITKWINGLVVYVNAIKQLIAYILSLPARLLAYFTDCLQKAYGLLKAGFLDIAKASIGGDSDSTSSLIDEVKATIKETTNLIQNSAVLVSAPLAVLSGKATANTSEQEAATTAVFNAAGFEPPNSNTYQKP